MTRVAALIDVPHFTPNLVWWLAHHQAIGFSTLLATVQAQDPAACELMNTAAQLYDVRWQSSEASDATARQNALAKLVQTQGQDLDWALALAEDEYFLPTTETVTAYLDTFSPAPSKKPAVNWCITGLNGYTAHQGSLRAPRGLYTRHAPLSLADHRITRCFFQPAQQQALPDPFAQVEQEADWSQARILHDAAASTQGAAQHYYNRNEESFPESTRFLSETRTQAAALIQTALYRLWHLIKTSAAPNRAPDIPPPAPLASGLGFCNEAGQFLVLNRETGIMHWRAEDALRSKETPLLLAVLPTDLSRGWLYTSAPLALPYLPHLHPDLQSLPELLAVGAVQINFDSKDPQTLQLRHALSGAAFALPQNLLPRLSPLPKTLVSSSSASPHERLADLLRYGLSAVGLQQAVQHSLHAPAPSVLGSLLVHLPPAERTELLSLSPFLGRVFHTPG